MASLHERKHSSLMGEKQGKKLLFCELRRKTFLSQGVKTTIENIFLRLYRIIFSRPYVTNGGSANLDFLV